MFISVFEQQAQQRGGGEKSQIDFTQSQVLKGHERLLIVVTTRAIPTLKR